MAYYLFSHHTVELLTKNNIFEINVYFLLHKFLSIS